MNIIVTGGAGFIGSNFLNYFVPKYPTINFLNLDCLTYAGNLNNIKVDKNNNYKFSKIDITNKEAIHNVFYDFRPDIIVNFAAESHVDRSIKAPSQFIETNIVGTFNLIDEFKNLWKGNYEHKRFHHISTDEVYGYLGTQGTFTEKTPYDPSSPYSASKASSDHIVRAYHRTFGVPVSITNCSNNFGPLQHDEKMIPTIIRNAVRNTPIPVYGTGENVRDWLYVKDHCLAIWKVIFEGTSGESYNIGARNDISNNVLIHHVLKVLSQMTNKNLSDYTKLITFVDDRKGHDYRYAINPTKIETELNWKSQSSFEDGLKSTVKFYLDKYQKEVS
ncbi:dTDP-glucose 4,6-dehydratase [Liquorilactobacillus satsumensis]|uniref:dTDP-glucose 4,6-dehydratase n=1 Tax=Liquorilactobacillus satsumensis TaxID=259059 RepID=UPI0039E7C0B0